MPTSSGPSLTKDKSESTEARATKMMILIALQAVISSGNRVHHAKKSFCLHYGRGPDGCTYLLACTRSAGCAPPRLN